MLEEFDKDENAYKEFVKRIAVGIAQDDEIKILVLNSVIKDVATKNDIDNVRKEADNLRKELKADINSLENELKGYVGAKIDALNKRIDDLRNDMRTHFFGFMGGIIATLITIILTKII
jgi:polyhydroxyalkanoate synthesis regulator phasin